METAALNVKSELSHSRMGLYFPFRALNIGNGWTCFRRLNNRTEKKAQSKRRKFVLSLVQTRHSFWRLVDVSRESG